MAKLLQGWKNKDIPTKMVDLAKEITMWNVKSVKWFLLVMYDKIWIYRMIKKEIVKIQVELKKNVI